MASLPSKLPRQQQPPFPGTVVMFQPFSSSAQASFWQELAKLKVDVLGLDQTPLPITGTYAALVASSPARTPTPATTLPARLTVGIESLSTSSSAAAAVRADAGGPLPPQLSLAKECRVPGIVQNFNTDEAFRAFNKKDWLDRLGQDIWGDITEEGVEAAVLKDLGRLARFAILCFADIKRNSFVYWFAFPVVVSNPPFRHLSPPILLSGNSGSGGGGWKGNAFFSDAECLLLHNGFQAFRQRRLLETGDPSCPPFFCIFRSLTVSASPARAQDEASSSLSLEICSCDAFEKLDEDQRTRQDVMFGFIDPGTVPLAPGWPLRNFLLLLANRWRLKEATVLCYRGRVTSLAPADFATAPSSSSSSLSSAEAARAMGESFVLRTALQPLSSPSSSSTTTSPSSSPSFSSSAIHSSPFSLVTKGWEVNKGKYMPRRIDLSSMMDPIRLAEQSVDLNLKLMRWRLLPALDIPLLAQTKCLLIGAGTLGCSVARGLLGWGVRDITLIDNGKVALSNPVRQSLFEYADCLDGGKPKATAAAAALKRIFPGVLVEGHVMTIPMPGHPLVSEADQANARKDIEKLDGLVQECDVVFLLTDTRESRWLPTVLAAVHDKMLLNVALGFDTFMVMRHGAQSLFHSPVSSGKGRTSNSGSSRSSISSKVDLDRIGCYFCNDVVAPEDSTKDRTLDQQCTVTRPGLAPLASALAVELMVALLHHPLRLRAPADGEQGEELGRRFEDDPDRPLGILPQQIRGFLAHFTMILPVTRAFEHCTGCASVVVEAYRKEGAELVVRVCNGQGVLEEMTGLAQMRREADAMDMLWLDEEEEEVGGAVEGVEWGLGGIAIDDEFGGKEKEGCKKEDVDGGKGDGNGNEAVVDPAMVV
ncbi:hypothetical protein VYU27_001149 [Nannochloropsis oceanica]